MRLKQYLLMSKYADEYWPTGKVNLREHSFPFFKQRRDYQGVEDETW